MIGTEHDAPYFEVITRAIVGQPRSLQRWVGPSGLGVECDVALLHDLNGDEEPDRGAPWKPTVGTAVHAWLEGAFGQENDRLGYRRWLTETRVSVGTVGGRDVSGTCDLFDVFTRTVLDHKVVGPKMLQSYRAKGPSQQYRVQAHLYGRGYALAGLEPREVAIAFLPRDGELSRSYVWREPYDEAVALAALTRANTLWAILQDLGLEAALEGCAACAGPWCRWCRASAPVRSFFGVGPEPVSQPSAMFAVDA